jgi:hypothetical protein
MDTAKHENKNFMPRPHEIALIYIGEGRRRDNIPARDLNPREVIFYGGRMFLIRTGLYATPEMIKND